MRNRAFYVILVSFVAAMGLALAACGGDDSAARRDDPWRPSDRMPQVAQHWWWEPVERACEEDSDCEAGEHCRVMRLGTCPTCPRGEDAHVCVGRDGETARAPSKRR